MMQNPCQVENTLSLNDKYVSNFIKLFEKKTSISLKRYWADLFEIYIL